MSESALLVAVDVFVEASARFLAEGYGQGGKVCVEEEGYVILWGRVQTRRGKWGWYVNTCFPAS